MGCPKCEKQKIVALISDNDELATYKANLRDNFKCQRCREKTSLYVAHHYIPIDVLSTRWEPDNIITFCIYCRAWARMNPDAIKRWMIYHWGESRHEQLIAKSKETSNPTIQQLTKINESLQKG